MIGQAQAPSIRRRKFGQNPSLLLRLRASTGKISTGSVFFPHLVTSLFVAELEGYVRLGRISSLSISAEDSREAWVPSRSRRIVYVPTQLDRTGAAVSRQRVCATISQNEERPNPADTSRYCAGIAFVVLARNLLEYTRT